MYRWCYTYLYKYNIIYIIIRIWIGVIILICTGIRIGVVTLYDFCGILCKYPLLIAKWKGFLPSLQWVWTYSRFRDGFLERDDAFLVFVILNDDVFL